MKRIAVLITCFNRIDKTINCLDSLYNSKSIDDYLIDVYLVDDGSTDGTRIKITNYNTSIAQ